MASVAARLQEGADDESAAMASHLESE
jgi:hypothetical protein